MRSTLHRAEPPTDLHERNEWWRSLTENQRKTIIARDVERLRRDPGGRLREIEARILRSSRRRPAQASARARHSRNADRLPAVGVMFVRAPGGAWRRDGSEKRPAARTPRATSAGPSARGAHRRPRRTADSGHSDPSDPPPPPVCLCGCGVSLEGRPGKTRYATAACRMRHKRGPAPKRECACGCGRDLTGRARQARYINDRHRQHAAVDRVEEALDPRDPYRRFREGELAELQWRAEYGCRCNGHHALWLSATCAACGRRYRGAPRDLRELALLVDGGVRGLPSSAISYQATTAGRPSCADCGRPWLSDLNPAGRGCPACGGLIASSGTRETAHA